MKVFTIDDINILNIFREETIELLIIININKKIILKLLEVVYSLKLRYNILSLSLLKKIDSL